MAKKKDKPKPNKPKLIGRPTKYTEELADRICELIANSNRGLASICKEEGMPSRSTVHQWIIDNKSFSDKYARAKEDQADYLAEEMITLSDDDSRDGEAFVGGNRVQRSRLQIETRKWIASKLKPKKYGDKLDVTTGGEQITSFKIGYKKPEDTGD